MGERLSRGARKHNRLEKARARREGGWPQLLVPSVRISRGLTPTVEDGRPSNGFSYLPNRNPSPEEIMSAGMKLADFCEGVGERNGVPIGAETAAEILDELALDIRAGKVTTRTAVAVQVNRLGFLMGPFGSASVEINVAALGVMNALQANKAKFQ